MNTRNHQRPLILTVARWPVGGIRTYLRDLFSAPELEQFDFALVAPDEEGLADYLSTTGLRVKEWTTTAGSTSALARAIYAAITRTRPQLVHSHGFTSAVASGLPAKIARVRHLQTVHDVLLPSQFEGLPGKMQQAGLSLALRLADHLHCVTNDSRENLAKYCSLRDQRSNRITVIHHGVNVAAIAAAERRDLKNTLMIADSTRLFGFLGRFMAQKGFRVIVDSVAKLKQEGMTPQHFRVLAVGSGGFLREEQRYVASKQLGDFITFSPYEPTVFSTLKGLDCLIMPSLWEASGLLAMEAMVAGIPVIGTSCIGLRETLADSPAVITVPGSVDSLSTAMRDEVRDPRSFAAREFQSEATRRFDARQSFAGVANLYRRLVQ